MQTLRYELAAWGAVLLAVNLGLFFGAGPASALAFDSTAVAAGEWWRLATYPLVHIGPYHFVMDAGTFLLLYAMLGGRLRHRLGLVAAAAAGALALSWNGAVAAGLSGLSGVGHGLMAVAALDQIASTDRVTRRIGFACLVLVAGKSIIEAVTGDVVLAFLHLGDVGRPVAACHLGGLLGALLFRTAGACERLWSGDGGRPLRQINGGEAAAETELLPYPRSIDAQP